jgi:hypothetical protein
MVTRAAHGIRERRARRSLRTRSGEGEESVVSEAGSSKAKAKARAARRSPALV